MLMATVGVRSLSWHQVSHRQAANYTCTGCVAAAPTKLMPKMYPILANTPMSNHIMYQYGVTMGQISALFSLFHHPHHGIIIPLDIGRQLKKTSAEFWTSIPNRKEKRNSSSLKHQFIVHLIFSATTKLVVVRVIKLW